MPDVGLKLTSPRSRVTCSTNLVSQAPQKYFKIYYASRHPDLKSELTLSHSLSPTANHSSPVVPLTSVPFHSNYHQLNSNLAHLTQIITILFLFSLFLVSVPVTHPSFLFPKWYVLPLLESHPAGISGSSMGCN